MSKIVFACEGITEVNLIIKILELREEFYFKLKRLNNSIDSAQNIGTYLENNIYIANFQGVDNLKNFRKNFCKDRPLETDKLIFIVDADYYNDEKKNGGYENRKISIENHIKIIKETLESEYGENELQFDYYITPDNKSDGMTEDICLKSIQCQKIVKYVDTEAIPAVLKTGEANIKNRAKSAFMMVSATQDPLKGSSHLFIDNCFKLFNQETPEFQQIKEFIFKNLSL